MTQRQTDDTARVLKIFSEHCQGLPVPDGMTEDVQRWIQEAAAELKRRGIRFTDLFKRVAASDYLMGKKPGSRFKAQLSWILKPETIRAILSGKYDDRLPEPVKEPKRKVNFSIAEYERMALEWRPVYRDRETKL